MKVGYRFKTNRCGECEVLEYNGCFDVLVLFLDTGTRCVTSTDQIRKGTVKDRFLANFCGVGYLGEKVPFTKEIYNAWANMLKRCYEPSVQEKHPTYIGCTVSDEWLCFSNYHRWYVENYIEGFHIDKDKKVLGNKVYGPDTCLFISRQENNEIAVAKKYRLTRKDGTVEVVENMRKFCRENGLMVSGMRRIMSGERKTHKDFMKVELIK